MEILRKSRCSHVSDSRDGKYDRHSEKPRDDIKEFAKYIENKLSNFHDVVEDVSLNSGWQMKSRWEPNSEVRRKVKVWRKHNLLAKELEVRMNSLILHHDPEMRRLRADQWRLRELYRRKGRLGRYGAFIAKVEEEVGTPVLKQPQTSPSPIMPQELRDVIKAFASLELNASTKRWNVKASAKSDTRPVNPIVLRM